MTDLEESNQSESRTAMLAALQQLIDVVAQLRSPEGGCPWDLAQTLQTLTPYVIEEAYEVVDAIRSGDTRAIAEELGDLLLQVVLQAQIASESGTFSLTEVTQGITQKLIRRHPHVFGDVEVQNVEQVRQNWEQIKAAEKGESSPDTQPVSRKLSRYARTLPPLMAGMKISQKQPPLDSSGKTLMVCGKNFMRSWQNSNRRSPMNHPNNNKQNWEICYLS